MANTKLPSRLLDTSAIPALNVTGDLTVDTTTLKVDSTNNRVGIGIASPSAKLHLKAGNNAYSGGFRIEGTDETTALAITHVNGLNFFSGNGTDDHLVLTGSGNVGIGISNPSDYYANFNDLVLGNTSTHAGMTIASGNGADGTIAFADGTSGTAEYQGYVQYNHGYNSLTFGTAATNRMTIDSSGQLSLATTEDKARMTIGLTGVAVTGDTDGATMGENAIVHLLDSNSTATNSTVMLLGGGGGATGQIKSGIGFTRENGTNWGTQLRFYTHSTSTSDLDELKERMRIDSSGNVGIGATSPSANLEIKPTGADASFKVTSDATGNAGNNVVVSQGTNTYITASHNMYMGVGGTADNLSIVGGNVGIGTTTPDYKLEVEGASGTTIAIKTPWAGNAYGQYKFATPTGEASMRSRVPGNSTVGLEFYTYGTNNGTAKMSILGDGNVGIANGNLVFGTAGKGIDFSAAGNNSGMTSETLDDYEEGNWTPSFVGGTLAVTTNSEAKYVKIGTSVTLFVYIQISNVTDATALYIQGVPFTDSGTYSACNIVQCSSQSTGEAIIVRKEVNDDKLYFTTALTQTAVQQTQVWGHIIFSLTYRTNS